MAEDERRRNKRGSLQEYRGVYAAARKREGQLTDADKRKKTDPSLQGMNGALTLGFIIIMVMTIIGFLIYWILSIKGRTLQFGILRAMGVSFGEIIGILGYEQLLVSGVSIICAFIIGGVTSDLFVPLFQYMYNVNEQIPPYRVAAMQADYIKMYILNCDNASRRICDTRCYYQKDKYQQGTEARRGLMPV